MQRYALFAGSNYYPNGGFWDFVSDADSIEILVAKAIEPWYYDYDVSKEYPCNYGWWHIVDTVLNKIVRENDR